MLRFYATVICSSRTVSFTYPHNVPVLLVTNVYRERKFFDVSDPYPVIVMEALLGESLLYRIISHRDISEKVLVDLFTSFIKSLLSIHRRGLIHRDIKLDNIMLQTFDADSDVKIVDFGMMVEVDEQEQYTDEYLAGTPGCHAPESITSRTYSTKSDVWQCGIVLYIMLTGRPPFQAGDKQAILRGAFVTGDVFNNCPITAKDLIRRMLTVSPRDRIALEDVLSHPWITEPASSASFTPEYQHRIQNLMCYEKLRGAFLGYDIRGESKHRTTASSDSFHSLPSSIDVDFEGHLLNLKRKVVRRMFPLVEKIQPVQDSEKNSRFLTRLHLKPTRLDYAQFEELAREADLDILLVPGMFRLFDKDGSGDIDLKEFLIAILTLRQSEATMNDTDTARLYFSLFDLDEDGYLSYEEFKWMVVCLLHDSTATEGGTPAITTGISTQMVDEAFHCMDDNSDMRVDFEEFKRFYHSLVYSNMYSNSDAGPNLSFESASLSLFSSNGSSILFTPSTTRSRSFLSLPSGGSPQRSAVGVVEKLLTISDNGKEDTEIEKDDVESDGEEMGDKGEEDDKRKSRKRSCTIQ